MISWRSGADRRTSSGDLARPGPAAGSRVRCDSRCGSGPSRPDQVPCGFCQCSTKTVSLRTMVPPAGWSSSPRRSASEAAVTHIEETQVPAPSGAAGLSGDSITLSPARHINERASSGCVRPADPT